MGNDVRQNWVNNNYAMEGIQHERDGQWHRDFWGIKWEKQGDFNQPVEFPLAASGEQEALAYPFPYGRLEELLAGMQPLAGAPDRGRFFLGCDVSPCVFEMYWRLRGLEQALVDIASRPRPECWSAAPLSPAGFPRRPAGAFPWTGCGPATTWPASRA
jgi:hypothetical protein